MVRARCSHQLGENGKLVKVQFNNGKDRYFNITSKYSSLTSNIGGKMKYMMEDKKPNFSIITVYTEIEGAVGHAGLGYDGKVIGFYPTDTNNSDHFEINEWWGTDLVLDTKATREFDTKYPHANAFFLKVTNEQKENLIGAISDRASELKKNPENYSIQSNNCTTNLCSLLQKSGISSVDSMRPGTLDTYMKNSNTIGHMIKQRPVVNINPTSPGGRLINEKKGR